MAWNSDMAATANAVTATHKRKGKRSRSVVLNPVRRRVRAHVATSPTRRKKTNRSRSAITLPTWPRRYYTSGRGLWRIINTAEYRFYRKLDNQPVKTDTWFAVNATLPFTPTETFGDGVWWIGVTRFDGNLESGFLPLGNNGATFLRLEISGGIEVLQPPQPPNNWHLERQAGGVVRVKATYKEFGETRATQWALFYVINNDGVPLLPTLPPAGTPTETIDMPERGLAVLSHDLPAGGSGDAVRLYVLTRRSDGAGGWLYSDPGRWEGMFVEFGGSVSSPLAGDKWIGRVAEP